MGACDAGIAGGRSARSALPISTDARWFDAGELAVPSKRNSTALEHPHILRRDVCVAREEMPTHC
jgi:hypothetical protein